MQKIVPFLWFDDKAEEAANYYVSIFSALSGSAGGRNSTILGTTLYGEEGPGPKGTVMTVAFQLYGQDFVALNGGPQFNFSPAISFVVNCETQQEIDKLWEKLSEGGEKQMCGWLQDKFGVSWQIIPNVLSEMLQDEDPEKLRRVMTAMLQMNKIEIAGLKQAFEQT